jgi:glyoxylase-like metal-dependent hydrolase (beta-lactamase superfamily II)
MPKWTGSASSSRRDFLKSASLCFGAAAAASLLPERLFAQTDEEKIAQLRARVVGTIKLTPLSGKVLMISGAGGNIAVLTGPEGKLMVDAGVSTAAPDVLKALAGLDTQPLKYLVNTHWHFDHTEGNEKMHDAGATIIAHAKTRERLATSTYVDLVKIHFPPLPTGALPTSTLTDEFTLFLNDEEVILQHVPPSHTDTDLFVLFKQANVLHVGDLFFNGFYPLIDYSTGGSINGTVDGIARALAAANANTKVIPGHGPLATKADFTGVHDMLATLRDRVAAAKKSGKSLVETITAKPSAEFDAQWGKGMIGPDAIVTLIYNTL